MQPIHANDLPSVDASFSFVGLVDGKPLVVCSADDFATIEKYNERYPNIEWEMGGPDDGRLYYLCQTENVSLVWTGEDWGCEPKYFSDLGEAARAESAVCAEHPGLLVTTACQLPD